MNSERGRRMPVPLAVRAEEDYGKAFLKHLARIAVAFHRRRSPLFPGRFCHYFSLPKSSQPGSIFPS